MHNFHHQTHHEPDKLSAWHTLAAAPFDWARVRRVLVVRLRSIGDTVLTTPTLAALRRFLPEAKIDILLEDWVAPLLTGHTDIDEVVTIRRGDTMNRVRAVRGLRQRKYDVVFNLHGGTTATLLTRATGAPHRVGFRDYQYGFLHNHRAEPAAALWERNPLHSVEQQLAIVASVGVPVTGFIPTRLTVTHEADTNITRKLDARGINADDDIALLHPAAAFDTKQWATENFARIAEHLAAHKLKIVALAAKHERTTLEKLRALSRVSLIAFDDLTLPEVTALAARAQVFVGNDSGIAHIAAAVRTPSVVIFGSSNVAHWRPWMPNRDVPVEVVREEMPCQPCAGYECLAFDEPECIKRVTVERVMAAIDRVAKREDRNHLASIHLEMKACLPS